MAVNHKSQHGTSPSSLLPNNKKKMMWGTMMQPRPKSVRVFGLFLFCFDFSLKKNLKGLTLLTKE